MITKLKNKNPKNNKEKLNLEKQITKLKTKISYKDREIEIILDLSKENRQKSRQKRQDVILTKKLLNKLHENNKIYVNLHYYNLLIPTSTIAKKYKKYLKERNKTFDELTKDDVNRIINI